MGTSTRAIKQAKALSEDLCIFGRRKMVSWLLLVGLLASTAWAAPPPILQGEEGNVQGMELLAALSPEEISELALFALSKLSPSEEGTEVTKRFWGGRNNRSKYRNNRRYGMWISAINKAGNTGDRHGQNFYDGQDRWNIY